MLTLTSHCSANNVSTSIQPSRSLEQPSASVRLVDSAWVTGLDKSRAEELLDYLEVHGQSCEVRLDGTWFAVRAKNVMLWRSIF